MTWQAHLVVSYILWWGVTRIYGQTSKCPPSENIAGCPCYNFEDGLFIECAGATDETLRRLMQSILNDAGPSTVVQSLSILELDKSIQVLEENTFPAGSQIRHLRVSHSYIHDVSERAFWNVKNSLESLALVSSRLRQVPQKSLAELHKLAALDLETNLIEDLSSYCFWGLKLMKLSLKGNEISKISEHTFAGLEDSLGDLDLAENNIKTFPMTALRRLNNLVSLRLAWNEISEMPNDDYSSLSGLLMLDLSSNNFNELTEDCFRPCSVLHTLSLYYNSIETIHMNAFESLRDLESIDLSHNKIVFLDAMTFKSNERLRTIELSHNHIHYISQVFSNLPELYELYLTENKIFEIPADAFIGSINLAVIYLQQNAIRRIDSNALSTLNRLTQLHLSNNYIENMPKDFLHPCYNLSSLSLDGNKIYELYPGSFNQVNQLRELRLHDNHLTHVKNGVFLHLPKLIDLYLQNNDIVSIESGAFSSLDSLQNLNLQGNQLTNLRDAFQMSLFESSSVNRSLHSIQVDNKALSRVHKASLLEKASVRIMWLSHNKLTHLEALFFHDLMLVERLYLTNNSISKIEDATFQAMQALKFLELSMNRLIRISAKTFAELSELEELYLQDNGLQYLEPYAFTSLKKLRILDLANNNLTVVRENMFQQDLPSVRSLNLRNCSIFSFEDNSFNALENLNDLNLQSNNLTASELVKLNIPSLLSLIASSNNFSLINDKSFNGLHGLQELIMDDVQLIQLSEMSFDNNPNLVRLHLMKNQLCNLASGIFKRTHDLIELKLDHNCFEDIPYSALTFTTKLEILSLGHNSIASMDLSNLASLNFLRELYINNNQIDSVSGFEIANFSQLLTVDLSHNRLKDLPGNFFAGSSMLQRLDLSENNFKEIPAVSLSGGNLGALIWLNLDGNPLDKIHELTQVKYPILQEIHISKTNLTIVTSQEFEAFPALLHLYLAQNCIQRISPGAFKNLLNLLTLDLGTNSVEILPKERLQGMELLKILNFTHNLLKELEEFPSDLKSLQILDLSYNQIGTVGKMTFKNLVSLVELHLYGNWINTVSSEAFRPLKKLRLLDLSRNYLENLPLNAFRPLETQIRSLRAEENPLHCGCESQELWEWLRDHQKLVRVSSSGREGSVDDVEAGLLRCEQPPELRGLVFLDLDPHAFCSAPLVLKLAIQDIQPFSVFVSWQSRNHSGLHGYQVAYHALNNVNEIRSKLLDPKARSLKLSKLTPDTRYVICVVGLGSWGPTGEDFPTWNTSVYDQVVEKSAVAMINTPMSRCTEVRTLDAQVSVLGDDETPSDRGGLASILTRRLGLIVGSCMGLVVFIVLVSILGYLKVKKQRAAIKREQPLASNPPEYMSYRHFSLQNADRLENPCPSFISNIGSTILSS